MFFSLLSEIFKFFQVIIFSSPFRSACLFTDSSNSAWFFTSLVVVAFQTCYHNWALVKVLPQYWWPANSENDKISKSVLTLEKSLSHRKSISFLTCLFSKMQSNILQNFNSKSDISSSFSFICKSYHNKRSKNQGMLKVLKNPLRNSWCDWQKLTFLRSNQLNVLYDFFIHFPHEMWYSTHY